MQSLKMEDKQRAEMAEKIHQLELEDSSAQDSSWLNQVCISCEQKSGQSPCVENPRLHLAKQALSL